MKESIASRVGRIISGSLNQLLSAFENSAPEAVMEKAIQEIDAVIEDVRSELGKVTVDKYHSTRRLTDATQRYRDLEERLEVAVQENRDDLAEVAIARQLDLEAQIPVLEAGIQALSEKEKELEAYIAALQAKKRDMKEELRQFREARNSAGTVGTENGPAPAPASNISSRVSRAEDAFERVMENQTHLPGAAADLKSAGKLAELEELARRNRIQERLAALKAKVKDAS